MAVSDVQALQNIIDSEDATATEKLKAIELKARLAGRIGTGKGDRPEHELSRFELEGYVGECAAEMERRKALN